MERTTVRLPPDLLDRARKKARDEGRTLTSLIEQGLREVVAQRPRTLPRKDVKLPVSSVSGSGLAPGLNPETLSKDVQALEDLDYIERLENGFR